MVVVGAAWGQLWAGSTLKHATVSIVSKSASLHQRKGRENLFNKAQLRVTLDTTLSCSPYRIYLYSREPLWNLSRISFKVSLKCATDVSIPFMTIKLDFNSPFTVHLLIFVQFFPQEIDQQKKRYTGTPPFGAMITSPFGTTKSFSLFWILSFMKTAA